jgi:6-pyruvoyltetrahydropterin/6-carboxytetrahydropterin synthase
MSTVLLTKRAVFGRCYNSPAHGHNYFLELTVSGEIDPKTGMVVNLFDLKRVLLDVIEEFDHKNLNLDMPYFKDRIPTSENFAHVLWEKLAIQQDIGTLHTLRLCEDEDLYAEITAADGREMATVTKRFTFNAAQGDDQGRDWDCFVTVRGKIDPTTGMVTDIGALDRLVEDQVIKKFDKQNLSLPEKIWLETSSRNSPHASPKELSPTFGWFHPATWRTKCRRRLYSDPADLPLVWRGVKRAA